MVPPRAPRPPEHRSTPAATGTLPVKAPPWSFPRPPLLGADSGTVLTQAIGPVQQRRRAALAHQCRSCRQLWALRLDRDPSGWLIFCRYCGAPRAAQPDEEALLDTGADVIDKADT